MNNLLSTVYSQSWPAPVPNKLRNKHGFYGKIPQHSSQQHSTSSNKLTTTSQHQSRLAGRFHDSTVGRGKMAASPDVQSRPSLRDVHPQSHLSMLLSRHTGLDEKTYKWESWTNTSPQGSEGKQHDLTLYKITQDTFRKLSEQVRETSQQINKYHSSGFRHFTDVDRPIGVIRPSQLAVTLPHHPPTINTDNNSRSLTEPSQMTLQCCSIQKSHRRRPQSHSLTSRVGQQLPRRPHSTTALDNRRTIGAFDQLTPQVIGALSIGKRPSVDVNHPGPFDIVAASSAKPEFGIDGDSDSDDEGSVREYRVRKPPDFELPAEDLDVNNHRSMFEYRRSSVAKRQEPFPEPLRKPYCYMDLLELSLMKEDWRHAVRTAPTGVEGKIIDRLIEMERLQTASIERETDTKEVVPPRRAMSALQVRKRWNAAAAIPTERAQSALARSKQSRNCASECLQPLCAGDCEVKSKRETSGCSRCNQEHCQGSCIEYGYHLHVRRPRQEEGIPTPARPKSCKSCNGRTSSARRLNADAAVLGRPRSAFATFSNAKRNRKPRKISAVSMEMAKLRLSCAKPGARGDCRKKPKMMPGSSGSKPHGRNAAWPGKSFTSQRRNSLTEEPISTSGAKMNPQRSRINSANRNIKQTRR